MLATVPLRIQNAFDGMFGGFSNKGMQSRNNAFLAAAFLLAVLPFEMEHLFTMLLGAAVYFAFYSLQPRVKRRPKKIERDGFPYRKPSTLQERSGRPTRTVQRADQKVSCAEPRSEPRTCTVSPVVAPKFQGSTWEEEVAELLTQITPTVECERTVAQLTRVVKKAIWSTFPNAEVMGFASANLQGGKAFGVAVPDVDIVANVSPQTLMQRLQKRSRGRSDPDQCGSRQLQKYAIRLCTEKLVSATNLKFRRSAFRGDEPKVTLLAPAAPGFSDISVPLDLSVNSLTPLHNAALSTECGKIDARAKALILLVKRWAKDRGICHAAKGHLPPYAWTLLVIYFLQVGDEEEGPLLPPVSDFEVSSRLSAKRGDVKPCKAWAPPSNSDTSVAQLLVSFFQFYSGFDWRNEAVNVDTGKRGPPSLKLPLHIMDSADGQGTEVGPSVEDPFATNMNLSSGMTAWSFARMQEELKRADTLCGTKESLATLLEPWAPPEVQHQDNSCDQDKAELDNED